MRTRLIYPFLVVLLLLGGGCIGQKASPQGAETGQRQKEEIVGFINEDGVTLAGTFYPAEGDTAVLLAHMGIADQTSWQDFAAIAAGNNIAALTFDFQCYGKSECKARGGDMSNLKDMRPAYEFLKEKGYEKIVCMGASMGGTACLMLAMEKEIAGLVVIASERPIGMKQYPEDLVSKSIPKLFIVADRDPYAFVISEIQKMYDVSPEPKQLKIFSGDVHGTDIFKTDNGTAFRDLLLEFLEEIKGKSPTGQSEAPSLYTEKIGEARITVIYDNLEYAEGFKTDWGFSCLIQAKKTILFDTGGNGDILMENMEKMDILPEDIDVIIISHNHADHMGGLNALLVKNNDVTVYVPESLSISQQKSIEAYGAEMVSVTGTTSIIPAVYSIRLLGAIEEQSLVINTERGLVVVTGCAHPSILRIVEDAKKIFKDDVFFVMGGWHVSSEESSQILNLISQFRNLGVSYVAPSHCSGELTIELFREGYGKHFIESGVGRIITLHDLTFYCFDFQESLLKQIYSEEV